MTRGDPTGAGPARAEPRRSSLLIQAPLVWAALFATYIAFVDELVGPELLAGAISAALVAGLALHLGRCTGRSYRLPPRPRLALARLPGEILLDTWRLSALVFRREVPEGASRTIPFDSRTDLPPDQDAGRRALVVARMCAAPNGFVVLRERERPGNPGRLLLHEMLARPSGPAGDTVWPH